MVAREEKDRGPNPHGPQNGGGLKGILYNISFGKGVLMLKNKFENHCLYHSAFLEKLKYFF